MLPILLENVAQEVCLRDKRRALTQNIRTLCTTELAAFQPQHALPVGMPYLYAWLGKPLPPPE